MVRLKFYVFIVIISSVILDAARYRCDYSYFRGAGGWLKLHRIPANWQEARLRCHFEGAKLASPLTLGIQKAMTDLIGRENVTCGIFTGVHATFSRGDFASIEGVPFSKIPHTWAPGEPDNFKNKESCFILLPDGTTADVDCEDTFPYICYKAGPKNQIVTNCGTTDTAYSLDPRTGHCYKFHRVPRTWSRAYMNCMAEGGYLIILNNDAEVQIVKDLFDKNPATTMRGNFWKNIAHAGFHDWNEHGEWLTIEGQTLEAAGYDVFNSADPNNGTAKGEFCGSVYKWGQYADIWCDNINPFICEKDPNSLLCPDEIDDVVTESNSTDIY